MKVLSTLLFATLFSQVTLAESINIKMKANSSSQYQKDGDAYVSNKTYISIKGSGTIKLGLLNSESIDIDKTTTKESISKIYLLSDEIRVINTMDGKTTNRLFPAKISEKKVVVKGKYMEAEANDIVKTGLAGDEILGSASTKASVDTKDFVCERSSTSLLNCSHEIKMKIKVDL
jgi:hypothetical protein